jgi:hypothetical protein
MNEIVSGNFYECPNRGRSYNKVILTTQLYGGRWWLSAFEDSAAGIDATRSRGRPRDWY